MKLLIKTFVLFSFIIPTRLWSLEVLDLKTKNGISLWFVEDNSVPIISLSMSFKGGSYFDKIGKEGTSSFVAALLDEGSENMNAREFQEKIKSLGMKLNISTSKDELNITFQTVSSNKAESFDLLRRAITKPRFSSESIEKVRNQISASLRIEKSDIQQLSSKVFDQNFYVNHNFSKSKLGTIDSISNINREDLLEYTKKYFTKSNMILGVSGNIDKEELLKLIDSTFFELEDGNENDFYIPKFVKLNTGIHSEFKETPQTSVVFGHHGLMRNNKDFFAIRIANYVLGGGGFQSKLYKKVREERGLVYSIYSYLIPFINDGIIIGGFQTRNDSVKETIDLVKKQWKESKEQGITKDELKDAKSYFIGSFSRNYTSTLAIAALLETVQKFNLGIDYFTKRKEIIENLTVEYINEVSKSFFDENMLFFAVVGNP
ncbi:insulinase family protein [Rickettsiales bacterium]|nr:insulinase family protein [Rickettsiales bacterium]